MLLLENRTWLKDGMISFLFASSYHERVILAKTYMIMAGECFKLFIHANSLNHHHPMKKVILLPSIKEEETKAQQRLVASGWI